MDKRSGAASAHLVVGRDGSILTTVPWDEVAYHAGCPKGNTTSIGIEVCEEADGSFNDIQIQTLKELIAEIKQRFPKINNIVRHWDWTNSRYPNGHKECPRYYTGSTKEGQQRWEELLKVLS